MTSFINSYPRSTNIDTSTGGFLAAPNEAEIDGINSLNENYRDLLSLLDQFGYADEDLHEGALTIMFDIYQTGVKLLKKDSSSSEFKELSFRTTTDAQGKINKIIIEKCK